MSPGESGRPLLFGAFLLFPFAGWGAPRTIAIDTARAGTPISPYLYGQFIEHLGRGVYGGLWAEMLEDRKFFFIIRDRYAPWGTTSDPNWGSGSYDYLQGSPWKVIGPPDTVSMDTDNPFTGIHSPVVHLPKDGTSAGHLQDGLALVQGRAYTGRVVLASDPGVSVVVRVVGDSGRGHAAGRGEAGPASTGRSRSSSTLHQRATTRGSRSSEPARAASRSARCRSCPPTL